MLSFQSTRPVRGATPAVGLDHRLEAISIHAPRAGRDVVDGDRPRDVSISIHAPRAGRDGETLRLDGLNIYFNPRAPCGARPVLMDGAFDAFAFQSTRPVRGATAAISSMVMSSPFQSTRPVRGATSWAETTDVDHP